jgi:preprotein translocase subunit SecF
MNNPVLIMPMIRLYFIAIIEVFSISLSLFIACASDTVGSTRIANALISAVGNRMKGMDIPFKIP